MIANIRQIIEQYILDVLCSELDTHDVDDWKRCSGEEILSKEITEQINKLMLMTDDRIDDIENEITYALGEDERGKN